MSLWLEDFWPVKHDGREVGRLVSACHSPRLGFNMGYVWLPVELAEMGTIVEIVSPAGPVVATVRALPFLDPGKEVPKG
jgi:aminomethyltransferase